MGLTLYVQSRPFRGFKELKADNNEKNLMNYDALRTF